MSKMMKLVFCTQIRIKVFYRLMIPFLAGLVRYAQIASQVPNSYKGNISKKTLINYLFGTSIKIFMKALRAFHVQDGCVDGPKSSWPIKFQNSSKCNILRIKCGMIYFLHVDQYQSFLQVNTMVFSEPGQACPES